MPRKRAHLPWALAAGLLLAVLAGPAGAQSPEALLQSVIENTGLSGDIVKRFDAQKRLVREGRASSHLVVPVILDELAKPHGYDNDVLQQRIALIEILRDIGVPAQAAVPALIQILEDQDRRLEWVHMSANMALAAIGTPEAESARHAGTLRDLEAWRERTGPEDIARAVAWHDFAIRQQLRGHRLDQQLLEASVLPLLVVGPEAGPAASTLLRAYGDPRVGAELRGLLVRTLGALGVRDIPAAADALPPAPEPLAEMIADVRGPDEQIRSFAIIELVRAAPDEQAVQVLIELLRAGQSPGAVANALKEIGAPAATRALPDLLPHLNDRRNGANVIQAVEALGADDPAAIAALIAVLADRSNPIRGLAASALGRLGAADAVPELTQALEAKDKYTRILAAKALGRIGPPAAEPAVAPLGKLLAAPDQDLQRAGAEALGRLGSAAEPAVPALARLLEVPDRRVNRAAHQALSAIGGPAASQALAADAGRFSATDRREAERLVAKHGPAGVGQLLHDLPEGRALPLAREFLTDQDPIVAYLAAGALIRAGQVSEAVPVLAEMITSGQAGSAFHGRFGYDWLHSDTPDHIEALLAQLADHLTAQRPGLDPAAQARVDGFLRAFGRPAPAVEP